MDGEYKIDEYVKRVYESYYKTIESNKILLKCDLKLFLWTFISKEIYYLVERMGPPATVDYTKTEILAIFNVVINNQIVLAERIISVFTEELTKKTNHGGGAAIAKTVIRHMKYIIDVCRELYRLPDFTDIQDLTFMYMSEELNRIHVGPIH